MSVRLGEDDVMKKGFTLIELLAVIVILAIIALIAVPIILSIIGDTKEETTIDSGEVYLSAVKNAIARENLTHEFNPSECEVTEEGNLNCSGEEILIETNGKKPSGGYIEIEEGEIINVEELLLGEYELETDDNKKLVIVGPNNGKQCRVRYATTTPNKPDLMDNALTPVKYDGNNWVITTSSDTSWYNYTKQDWANAVILSDIGKSKQVGEKLSLPTSDSDAANSDVVAMFVWIPRYEYRIEGQYGKCGESAVLPGAIDIKFVESSKKDADEDYIMHPAFTFGNKELSGIWVGKFETSTKVGSTCYTGDLSNYCDNTNQEPYILPNVKSLRRQTVSNQFETAKKFNVYLNSAGDGHMSKNSEWGAVAYLSQSKYGKYGNSNYAGANKEIYKNNSSEFYTGRSGGAPGGSIAKVKEQYPDNSTSTDEYYNYGYYTYEGNKVEYDGSISTERDIKKGVGASTTGNITGIYDMSGGTYDNVMGYLTTAYGSSWWGSTSYANYADFRSKPDAKYFDGYKETSTSNCINCIGHALGETSNWYGDFFNFTTNSYPWFKRGGDYNTASDAGVFYFNGDRGSYGYYSFRVVISPTT